MTHVLPMNRPGHRIVAWLGKAALKTHALQTLRDCRASPKRAKRLECVRFIGAFRRARDGPMFMVPMHSRKVGDEVERLLQRQCLRGLRRGENPTKTPLLSPPLWTDTIIAFQIIGPRGPPARRGCPNQSQRPPRGTGAVPDTNPR